MSSGRVVRLRANPRALHTVPDFDEGPTPQHVWFQFPDSRCLTPEPIRGSILFGWQLTTQHAVFNQANSLGRRV